MWGQWNILLYSDRCLSIKICILHITITTVNIIVYLIVCIYFVPIEVMCLNNRKLIEDDSSYKSLVESLNAEITNTSESCEYLETDSKWSIETSDLLVMQLSVRGLRSNQENNRQ